MCQVISNGIETEQFNGLRQAIDHAWRLADSRPGVYRIVDDNMSSYVTAATVRATIDLRDVTVAPEYMAHYIASRKAN